MCRLIIFLTIIVPIFVNCLKIVKPGPKFLPSKGKIWPKPQQQTKEKTYYVFESYKAFNVTKPFYTCDIVDEAVNRLLLRSLFHKFKFVRDKTNESSEAPVQRDSFFNGTIISNKTEFRIELTKECEKYPHLEMNESYTLVVRENIVLTGASVWGILRGLESFNHLLYFANDYTEIRINTTIIKDFPAYKHRGLLIDTGRHYLSPNTISLIIDAMEMNKLNVLHWHIVDDQSFPYQSEKFPTLSENGAFDSSMVYTKYEIQQLVERARLAGIRVIPEFDIPGHVRSWGESFPEILTKCYIKNEEVGLGPLDPTNGETYTLLQHLYQELKKLFPDQYIHLGGDEVDLSCWRSNPKIRDYMQKNNITSSEKLFSQFMHKVQSLLPSQATPIFWQDVVDDGVPLTNKTIIQMWRNQWVETMDEVLKAGYQVVVSAPWYLDNLSKPWEQYFMYDPRTSLYSYRFQNASGIEGIVGGEVCMWGEKVDEQNVMTRIWPRSSAAAERMWTGLDFSELDYFRHKMKYVRRRMEEHVCRMIQRGVPVEPPNGPGFCIGPVSKHLHQSHDETLDARDKLNEIATQVNE